jgi:hypothetical protein
MFNATEYKLTKVEWKKNGDVLFASKEVGKGTAEWMISSEQFYDIPAEYQSDGWKGLLKKGSKVRLWCIHMSQTVGMEVAVNGLWEDVWCRI